MRESVHIMPVRRNNVDICARKGGLRIWPRSNATPTRTEHSLESYQQPQHLPAQIRKADLPISLLHRQVKQRAIDAEEILKDERRDKVGDIEPYLVGKGGMGHGEGGDGNWGDSCAWPGIRT